MGQYISLAQHMGAFQVAHGLNGVAASEAGRSGSHFLLKGGALARPHRTAPSRVPRKAARSRNSLASRRSGCNSLCPVTARGAAA